MERKNVRHVILITIDCLRYDYSVKFARFINTFFRRYGNIFTNVYTHGVGTPAAFPAIMTSTYPLMFSGYPYLGRIRQTLAEVMRMMGFFTIGLAPNPYLSRHFGYSRGFNLYFDYMPTRLIERFVLNAEFKFIVDELDIPRYTQLLTPYIKGFILVGMTKYILKKMLKLTNDKKIFLWIHFMDLHAPLTLPYIIHRRRNINLKEFMLSTLAAVPRMSRLINKTVRQFYSKSLIELDWYIGAIIDILEHMRLLDNSLIILTSDHGEELMEDGIYGHPPLHSERTLHVPLYVYPRIIDSHTYVNSLKGLIDLAPSIVELLGFNNILLKIPWYGNSSLFSINGGNYIVAETAHTSTSSDIDEENLKYSVITHNKIITYKPYNNLVVIRNKQTNKIVHVSKGEHADDIGQYISVIYDRIKLEKRTRLIEKIQRIRKRIKR